MLVDLKHETLSQICNLTEVWAFCYCSEHASHCRSPPISQQSGIVKRVQHTSEQLEEHTSKLKVSDNVTYRCSELFNTPSYTVDLMMLQKLDWFTDVILQRYPTADHEREDNTVSRSLMLITEFLRLDWTQG